MVSLVLQLREFSIGCDKRKLRLSDLEESMGVKFLSLAGDRGWLSRS